MKKMIFISAAALLMTIAASSCNKMCVCTTTYEDPNYPSETEEVDLRDAGQKKCSDLNIVIDRPNGRTTIECVKKTN
jgi:hypothetical protein